MRFDEVLLKVADHNTYFKNRVIVLPKSHATFYEMHVRTYVQILIFVGGLVGMMIINGFVKRSKWRYRLE